MILGECNLESFDQGKLVIAVRMALAMGALIAVGSAFAQDATGNKDASSKPAKSLETVVVTGARIRSVDVETAQPVFTMTQADIKKTGLVNVGDILQNLTVVGEPAFSKAAVLTSNSEEGGCRLPVNQCHVKLELIGRWAGNEATVTLLFSGVEKAGRRQRLPLRYRHFAGAIEVADRPDQIGHSRTLGLAEVGIPGIQD
jgi:hypothetical protein